MPTFDDLVAGVRGGPQPAPPRPIARSFDELVRGIPTPGTVAKPPVEDEKEPTILDTGVTFGLRVVPAIAGGALAGLTALPSVVGAAPAAALGGAAGAGLGEAAAEGYETWRGLRKELNPTQIATQTALGAIPMGKQAAGLKGLLQAGAKGTALGAGSYTATELAEGKTPTAGGMATAGGLGLVLGAGTHGVIQRLQRLKADRAAAELEAEANKFKITPVHPASETLLADMLRGRGPVEARPQFSRASAGEDLLPVGVRRPELADDAAIARGAADVPLPGETPRGSFRQYLMSDADVQAELAAERNASQAAQDAEWEAQKRVGPEVRPDLGAALDAAAARDAGAKRSLLGVLKRTLAERVGAEQDVAGAVAGSEQAARRGELEGMLRLGTPEDLAAREAAREAALPPEPVGDSRGGGALPIRTPAAGTALAGVLHGEQKAKSRYELLKLALGFGDAKPEPALGPVVAKAGKEFPLTVEERATLGEVRSTFREEPPIPGKSVNSPFYDAVRAAGNPKWTNADIRAGIDRLLEGRENIYGRAALAVAKERFPAQGAPWQHGFAGVGRPPGVRGSFLNYLDSDRGVQQGIAREAEQEQSALARFMESDDPTAGLDPRLVGKRQVGPSYPTPRAAEAAAAALRAQGREAIAFSYDRNAHVVLEPKPAAAVKPSREVGQEGFAVPRVISTLAGGTGGAALGATQGDTPAERAKYAALYGFMGAGAGYAGMRALEHLPGGERGSIPIGKGRPLVRWELTDDAGKARVTYAPSEGEAIAKAAANGYRTKSIRPLPEGRPGAPVGKVVRDRRYLHRSAESQINARQLAKAKAKLPAGFQYDVVVEGADGSLSFVRSPDFDTVPEPRVGDRYTVTATGDVTFRAGIRDNPQIFHGKETMVGPDYQGFDRAAAARRTAEWNALPGVDKNRIGYSAYWNSEVAPRLSRQNSFDPEAVRIANATSRSGGAIGEHAIVPRLVAELATTGEAGGKGLKILDFGAGKDALHAKMLRERGLDVTAHDFGGNVKDGIHDPAALSKAHDLVYASNVLNVQSSPAMLRTTIGQMWNATAPGGRVIANLPFSPRKFEGLNPALVEQVLKEQGFTSVTRIGGSPREPVYSAIRPKASGEAGFVTPGAFKALTTGAGALVGGAAGATQGETPGERAKNAALGALFMGGAVATGNAIGSRVAGKLEARLAGRKGTTELEQMLAGSKPPAKAAPATTERATLGLPDVVAEMARKNLPSAVDIPADRLINPKRFTRFGGQADDLVRVLKDPDGVDPGFAAQRRHRMPIPLQEALSRLIRVEVEKPGPVGKLLNAEETMAYSDALATLTDKTQAKAKALLDAGIDVNNPPAIESLSDPQIVQLIDWQETSQWRQTVFQTLWGSSSEQGRALAANKIMSRVRPSEIQVIREVMRKGRFGEDVLKAAKLWGNLDINDPVAVYSALKDANQRSAWDKVSGFWMSNVLSGIKTQERNALGNLSRFVTNTAFKLTAAAPLDALKATLTGKPRQFYAREAVEDVIGAAHSANKAWADFWYTLKNGFSKEYLETAMELEGGFFPRAEAKGLFGMGEGTNPTNWPGRILDAMDRAFYQLNAGAETYSQSYTRAMNEAKRLNLQGGARLDYVAKRAFELRKAPDLELQKGVHQASLEATYREPEGEFGRLIQQMRRVVPGMTFVMPFVKTVSNIGRQGYEITPLSLLIKGGKQMMGNERAWNRVGGGEREAAMMQAKAVFGTAASAFFAYLAANGGLSGSGPSDRAKRAQLMASGWRPNSIKLDLSDSVASLIGATKSADGQYWVNYSLLQPLAMPMSLVANSYEAWDEQRSSMVKGGKAKRLEQAAAQTISKVAKSALNQSYLQGMFSLVDAINNGQGSADKLIQQIAQGFVPGAGFLRNVTQGVDPLIRDPEGVKQGVMANIPGLSQNVSPLLGRFGEPIERSGSALRRFMGVPEVEPTTNDWIDRELNRLGVNVGNPTDRLTLPEWVKGDRKITEEQAVLLRQARGRATRASLAQLMRAPGYARMPEWAKTQMVRRAINRGTLQAANAARISFATGRPELLARMMAPINRTAELSYEPGQRKGT